MYGIIEREIFTYGFRLGGRLMLETLTALNFDEQACKWKKTTLKVLSSGVVYTLLSPEKNRLKVIF